MPRDVATVNSSCEVGHALSAGAVQTQLLVAVDVEVHQERVCGEHQRLLQAVLLHFLDYVYCGREVDVKVLVDDIDSSVGEAHVQVARGDEVHGGYIRYSDTSWRRSCMTAAKKGEQHGKAEDCPPCHFHTGELEADERAWLDGARA